MKLFEVGNVVEFTYNGKARVVRIEKVVKSTGNMFVGPYTIRVTGWDHLADYPTGGYRTFLVSKIHQPELVKGGV